MGRNRVVVPESIRLPLSDGDFLTVKKELNAGEYVDSLLDQTAGPRFAVLLAYLVGWSFVGERDQPLAYSVVMPADERRAILRSLDVATLVEIVAAVEAHAAANERAVQKKKPSPDLVLAS